MAPSSTNLINNNNNMEIPDHFICPITQDIMRDPLMCRNGLSFEREAIVDWLMNHNNTCPLTRKELTPRDLLPNRALKSQIQVWCNATKLLNGTIQDKNSNNNAFAYLNDEQDTMAARTNCNDCDDILFVTCLASSFEEHIAAVEKRRKQSRTSTIPRTNAAATVIGSRSNAHQQRRRKSLTGLFRRNA